VGRASHGLLNVVLPRHRTEGPSRTALPISVTAGQASSLRTARFWISVRRPRERPLSQSNDSKSRHREWIQMQLRSHSHRGLTARQPSVYSRYSPRFYLGRLKLRRKIYALFRSLENPLSRPDHESAVDGGMQRGWRRQQLGPTTHDALCGDLDGALARPAVARSVAGTGAVRDVVET
jgi:hypothetical protein